MSLTIGGSGSLECQVAAVPAAQITWFKNGRRVQLSTSDLKLGVHKLILRGVNYSNDGVYQCVAENRRGMIVSATWVHVQGPNSAGKSSNSVLKSSTNDKSPDNQEYTRDNQYDTQENQDGQDGDVNDDDFDVTETLEIESNQKGGRQSNIGVILGSLFGALGVAVIVAFILWKKFAKRMTSEERLRKRIIEEMVDKWREENPDMPIQEKRLKVLNYFRNLPSTLKHRLCALLERTPVSKPSADVQEMQGDYDDLLRGECSDPEVNTAEDNQEHQVNIPHGNPRAGAQKQEGDFHNITQEDKDGFHSNAQEGHGDPKKVTFHQEMQEDLENPDYDSSFPEVHQSDPPCQEESGQDGQESEDKLYQENSSQHRTDNP